MPSLHLMTEHLKFLDILLNMETCSYETKLFIFAWVFYRGYEKITTFQTVFVSLWMCQNMCAKRLMLLISIQFSTAISNGDDWRVFNDFLTGHHTRRKKSNQKKKRERRNKRQQFKNEHQKKNESSMGKKRSSFWSYTRENHLFKLLWHNKLNEVKKNQHEKKVVCQIDTSESTWNKNNNLRFFCVVSFVNSSRIYWWMKLLSWESDDSIWYIFRWWLTTNEIKYHLNYQQRGAILSCLLGNEILPRQTK